MVFDMIANAPGVLNSTAGLGPAAGSDVGGRRSQSRRCRSIRPPTTSSRHASTSGTSASSTSWSRKSSSTSPTSAPGRPTCCGRCRSTRVPFGATFLPQNQDPTRVPSATPGIDGAAERLPAAVPGLRQHPDVGLQRLRELQRAPDLGDPPVRPRVHGLRLLRLEQGAGDQQHRLRRRRAESQRRGDAGASTTRCWTTTGRTTSRSTPSTRRRVVTSSRGARPPGERLAALGRLPVDERPAVYASTSRFPASAPRT